MAARKEGSAKRAPSLNLSQPDPLEDELHKSVAGLLHIALMPPAIWTTFPSGMYKLPKSAGGRLRAYGLKEGMPDIFVLHDKRVVWIELKRRDGVISKVQKEMHERLEENQTPVYVCRSPEAVIDALVREGFPLRKGVVTTMLAGRPYQPAERQCIGDPYFGQSDNSTKTGKPQERTQGTASGPTQKTVDWSPV